MGCDGNTPNVICPNRINPIVQPWLAALPTPDQRRPAEQLPGAADPGHDPRQLRLLHGPRSTCSSAQRPRVREHLAPAGAREVRIRSCRRRSPPRPTRIRRTRGSTGSTTTASFSATLAEPHVDGVPEPQRGLRLGQPGLRRTSSRRSPAWPATTCRRTMRSATGSRRWGATRASTSATSRRGRPSSSTTR